MVGLTSEDGSRATSVGKKRRDGFEVSARVRRSCIAVGDDSAWVASAWERMVCGCASGRAGGLRRSASGWRRWRVYNLVEVSAVLELKVRVRSR